MSIYKKYKTNEISEQDGFWFTIGVNEHGDKESFKLARISDRNKSYQKKLAQKIKPYQRSITNNTMDRGLIRQIQIELFVEFILLDWTGLLDDEGNEILFSKDKALELLTELPDLYDDLDDQARDLSNFLLSRDEANLGN